MKLRIVALGHRMPRWVGDGYNEYAKRLPREYAARLYAALHDLDRAGVDRIVVAEPPQTDEWLGVRDRLMRASN